MPVDFISFVIESMVPMPMPMPMPMPVMSPFKDTVTRVFNKVPLLFFSFTLA